MTIRRTASYGILHWFTHSVIVTVYSKIDRKETDVADLYHGVLRVVCEYTVCEHVLSD